ncbi:hypothetical protein OKW38_002968 [Paraburkholderia sp. MM5496-R1]|uniref:hypothetical protein n=1 Tax=unclassified Paraburkholderia TaxID=2615204 RepID=UPI003D19A87A
MFYENPNGSPWSEKVIPLAGVRLPWGLRLSGDEILGLRGDLVELVEQVAAYECWAEEFLCSVMYLALHAPVSDLLPNLHHYRERLDVAEAEIDARIALDKKPSRSPDERLR